MCVYFSDVATLIIVNETKPTTFVRGFYPHIINKKVENVYLIGKNSVPFAEAVIYANCINEIAIQKGKG